MGLRDLFKKLFVGNTPAHSSEKEELDIANIDTSAVEPSTDAKGECPHPEVTIWDDPDGFPGIFIADDEANQSDDAEAGLSKVAPKEIGKLDMVIAFDTTGSMAMYIDAVRKEVSELIPELFKDNEDLRLGIVAFGDYCDMKNSQDFGKAYQAIAPTDNENDLIKFVMDSHNTSGGDGPEFYELVIKKIVEETPWREGSTRSILLIADATPHELGYTYKNYVVGNQIDWRIEAKKAADERIKIDTVTITNEPWFKELSALTNGVSVPFHTGSKTAQLIRASAMARGSHKAREKFDDLMGSCEDEEMKNVYGSYRIERLDF